MKAQDLKMALTMGRDRIFPIRTYTQFLQTLFGIPAMIALALVVVSGLAFIAVFALAIALKRYFLGPHRTWQRWFAWRPVRVEDGRIVWLKKVSRIGLYEDSEKVFSLSGVEYKR